MLVKVHRSIELGHEEELDEASADLVKIGMAFDVKMSLIFTYDNYVETTYKVPDSRAKEFAWAIDSMINMAVVDSEPESTPPEPKHWWNLKAIANVLKVAIGIKRLTWGL